MCFTRLIRKKRYSQTSMSIPIKDAWTGPGDSITFKKKRKKNIFNTNGKIHPENRGPKGKR
jgi:hypothetical protein